MQHLTVVCSSVVGVCAALGLQAALRSLPEPQQQRAKVTVLGCPAEENGHGGKVVMIEKGELLH